MAENENGESTFNSSDEVYDFIDDCRAEGITISELYAKIAEALNEEGFSKENEQERIKRNDIKSFINNEYERFSSKSAESAMSKIAEKQFQEQGFQGYEA